MNVVCVDSARLVRVIQTEHGSYMRKLSESATFFWPSSLKVRKRCFLFLFCRYLTDCFCMRCVCSGALVKQKQETFLAKGP